MSYGKTKHARVIYHDKNRPDDIYDNIDHGEIHKLVYEENLDKRENTSDIKEVQIFLPAKLLEVKLSYNQLFGEAICSC